MKETIRQVKEKYGSIEGYVKDECKLTDAEIKKVKDLMIVPIDFVGPMKKKMVAQL